MHHNEASVCKCLLQDIHMGQDEACYAAYALLKSEWVIDGMTKLRKKAEVYHMITFDTAANHHYILYEI
jgi:hypothetical protein